MIQTSRTVKVPEYLIPTTAEAVKMYEENGGVLTRDVQFGYEENGGVLTRDVQFGYDPLGNQEDF